MDNTLLANGEFADLTQLRYNITDEACYRGSEGIVRIVLQDQINLEGLWKRRTPLRVAIAEGHTSIVQLLLANGAKPAEYNPLCIGVASGSIQNACAAR
jgi:ankyrin repeat protein